MPTHLHKIHHTLLYAFLFFLPWQTILIVREIFFGGEKWQYGTIGIYISDLFLITWILCSLYLYHKEVIAYITTHKKIIVSMLLCTLWIFFSIIWSQDHALALYGACKFSFACDMFILLQILPLSLRKASFAVIYGATWQSLIALHQFFTQSTQENVLLGIQLHDASWGGTAIITTTSERWLRAYGAMPHPNILGGLLCIALLLTIAIYITSHKKTCTQNITLLTVCGILSVGIMVSFSRVAWLTTIIGIIILFFAHRKTHVRRMITPIIIICSTAAIIFIFFGQLFSTRIIHDTHTQHNSYGDRKTYLSHAQTLIYAHPLIGTGISNYTNTAYSTNTASHPIWYFQPVHNAYILLLTETGIIGTLLLFCFIFLCIFPIARKMSAYYATYFSIFCGICIISLYDHWTWSSHFGLFFSAFFLGILMRKKTKNAQLTVCVS